MPDKPGPSVGHRNPCGYVLGGRYQETEESMRVLVIPEVYRPGDATACGTVNDATTWVERWLSIDENLHVYWLLPPRDRAGYDAEYVHADRERVTLIEAEGFEHRDGGTSMSTEDGYTVDELSAVREAVYDAGAYVDVVVD